MGNDVDQRSSVTKSDLSILKSELKIEIIEQNTKLFASIAILIGVLGLILMMVLYGLIHSLRP